MSKKKKIESFLWRPDPNQLEMLRRAKYDSNMISLNELISEVIFLGFPLFCEKYKISPSLSVKLKQELPKLEDTIIEDKTTFTIFHKPEEIKKVQDIYIQEKDLS